MYLYKKLAEKTADMTTEEKILLYAFICRVEVEEDQHIQELLLVTPPTTT